MTDIKFKYKDSVGILISMAVNQSILDAIRTKYYGKQPVGFCTFLANLGVVQDVNACVQAQTTYLQNKHAIDKWLTGLGAYARSIGVGGAVVR